MTRPGASRSYVYGVTSSACAFDPMPAGVTGARVRLLRHDGLAAIVSDYDGGELRELPRESLLRCLLDHQRVLERVVERDDVLPLEFGSVLESDREALEVLEHCRDGMGARLRSLQGSVEVEVAATWDLDLELRDLRDDPRIVQVRDGIAVGGGPSQEDRLRLGRLVRHELDRQRRRYRDQVMEAVRPVALELAANALVSDQMIVNVAVLVERRRRAELETRVDELDRALGPRLQFRVIGPMPPYTFSTIRVSLLSRTAVDGACSLLGLVPPLAESAVRHAFRARAAEARRLPDPEARIVELRAARDVLLSSAARVPAGGDRWVLSVRQAPGADEVEPAQFGAEV